MDRKMDSKGRWTCGQKEIYKDGKSERQINTGTDIREAYKENYRQMDREKHRQTGKKTDINIYRRQKKNHG